MVGSGLNAQARALCRRGGAGTWGVGCARACFWVAAGAGGTATPVRRRLAVTGLAMERKGER